jgi:hypothetical protein
MHVSGGSESSDRPRVSGLRTAATPGKALQPKSKRVECFQAQILASHLQKVFLKFPQIHLYLEKQTKILNFKSKICFEFQISWKTLGVMDG